MRRQQFIAALAGLAAAAPTVRAAIAQQAEKVRHLGILAGWSDSDPEVRGLGGGPTALPSRDSGRHIRNGLGWPFASFCSRCNRRVVLTLHSGNSFALSTYTLEPIRCCLVNRGQTSRKISKVSSHLAYSKFIYGQAQG